MTLPEGARGRMVAVALLLIIVILAVELLALPLYDSYRERDAEIADMQQHVLRYRRLIDESPELRALAERTARARPIAALVLPGSNPALAAADLQQRLQDLARQNAARVLSLRIRPPEPDGLFERISVEARVQADITALRNLLFALETGTPYTFVDTLTVRARPQRRRSTTGGSLEARLVLFGVRPIETGAEERG